MSTTSAPLFNPSVDDIAIVLTTLSPISKETSSTNFSFFPSPLSTNTSSAFNRLGICPDSNFTSTTGPITWRI